MIYFFDNELNMVKVTSSKNVISAVHEHELNGLILGTVETDLSYTEAFINDVDYFGYYYKDNYYLHKIKRVEHEHENELVRITGRHIFFEDMLYGDYIRDVRPVNRDALYILNQTISVNTRWQTVMTDTSKLHSETYYWVPPMEVLNDLTENVGIEYEPKILFDGQKINGFQLHVANRIGEDTPIRVPFGSRVLNLKYEVDYSEIVTALYGHGKGEEVGDGYGRRINFSSVNFSRNGVVSPAGQLYMENPSVTDQYGKDDGSPKFGRIIFEDIESASELANATYEAYLEQSRPKMLFEASVVDLGDVGMGDGVLIIRREYDVYFNARIHKLMVDLLDAENADVELGDYAHFKESKVQRKTRESNNQYRRETSSRIQQLKEQFNDRFDGEVNQIREDYEQALIDTNAEIQAAEQRFEDKWQAMDADINSNIEKIVGDLQPLHGRIDDAFSDISSVLGNLNTARSELQKQLDDADSAIVAAGDKIEAAEVRITNAEQDISKHGTDIGTVQQTLSNIDGELASKVERTEYDALEGTVAGHNTLITQNAEAITSKADKSEVNTLSGTVEEHTSLISQQADEIASRVTKTEIETRNSELTGNLIMYHDLSKLENHSQWVSADGAQSGSVFHGNLMGVWNSGENDTLSIESDTLAKEVVAGREYTLSFIAFSNPNFKNELDYTALINPNGDNQDMYGMESEAIGTIDGYTLYYYTRTFTAEFSGVASVRIGSTLNTPGSSAWFDFGEPKLEEGPTPTPYNSTLAQIGNRIIENETSITQNAEAITSKADKTVVDSLSGTVGEHSTTITQTAEDISQTITRVSKTESSIADINTTVDGITADFTNYKQDIDDEVGQLSGQVASYEASVDGFRAEVGTLQGDVDGLDESTLKKSSFILESDGFFLGGKYVGGDHYSTAIVGSKDGIDILADRMRVTGDLLVKGDVESYAVSAIRADFQSATARYFSANLIDSDWLNVDTALFNRFTSSEAFIDRLEVKAANIRDLTGTHIRGGLLDSLNGATRLNLNTGDWTIGGSAKIIFTNRNNRIEYSNRGITAGMQFDHSLGSDGRPMTAVGVSDGAFNVNDSTFRGLIVHSLGTEGLLGYGTNIISQDGGFYTRTDRAGSGINFRLHATGGGAPRGIYPQYTGTYDYNLGSSLNPWTQAYIRDIRTSGQLWIRDWNGTGGWHVGTIAESGRTTITFRGVNTNLWNYNLGSGTYRMNNIYLLSSPNVSSDKRLKEEIESSNLGLDFINGIEIKSFRKIAKEADINEGRLKNHVEFGLIAQQLRDNLISHGVDTEDVAMLSIDDDGYYGVQHEQLIAPTIKAVQDLDVKVESNTEKIKRLEQEIELLKGA